MDPKEGNYNIVEDSPALKLGFVNFPMDNFGVRKASLKVIAKTPDFPIIWSTQDMNNKKSFTFNLLGATLKNIETIEERSASGLRKTAGVLILKIDKNSVISKSKLQVGDVIIAGEGTEINTIPDLMNVYERYNWRGKLNLNIFRNQQEETIIINTK